MPFKICIAANEDGFGPSAFAYYLIRALSEVWRKQRRKSRLQVLLLNKRAYALNQALHVHHSQVRLVRLDSVIRLERREAEVDVPRTLRALGDYARRREHYCREASRYLRGCALAVDIGVPLLARAAHQQGVPNVTVFDHSWACTLRGIVSREAAGYSRQPVPTKADRFAARELAEEIEQDENCTNEVFLFDRYLTPIEFHHHWRALGFVPRIINGVFGSRENVGQARRMLNRILRRQGQHPVSATEPLILVTPGGTRVWAAMMPRMMRNYLDLPRTEYLPVFAPCEPGATLKRLLRTSANVRWFDYVPGGTLQAILPAFSLVIAKASGGTVNDCLASQTPLVCIEERQWQVKLIERECKRLGLIPNLRQTRLDIFEEDPVRCIDLFVAKCAGRSRRTVPMSMEYKVATAILQRFMEE